MILFQYIMFIFLVIFICIFLLMLALNSLSDYKKYNESSYLLFSTAFIILFLIGLSLITTIIKKLLTIVVIIN